MKLSSTKEKKISKFIGKNLSSSSSPRNKLISEKSKNNSVPNSPKDYKQFVKGPIASRNEYLYLYGKKKAENEKNLLEINRQKQIRKELEKCTFKPKINDYSNLFKIEETNVDNLRMNTKSNVVSRLFKWVNKKNEKIVTIKEKLQVYFIKEHTFKPKIINKANRLTTKPVELDEKSLNYVRRLQSVKEQQVEKNRRLYPDYNLLYEKNVKNSRNYTPVVSNNTTTIKHKLNNNSIIEDSLTKHKIHKMLYNN